MVHDRARRDASRETGSYLTPRGRAVSGVLIRVARVLLSVRGVGGWRKYIDFVGVNL